jgi:hypothetical protein
MVEFLVSFVQTLCLIGYLYGAWLVITHQTGSGSGRVRESSLSLQGHDDDAAWRRYIACDW